MVKDRARPLKRQSIIVLNYIRLLAHFSALLLAISYGISSFFARELALSLYKYALLQWMAVGLVHASICFGVPRLENGYWVQLASDDIIQSVFAAVILWGSKPVFGIFFIASYI